jgi:hypothetical protein
MEVEVAPPPPVGIDGAVRARAAHRSLHRSIHPRLPDELARFHATFKELQGALDKLLGTKSARRRARAGGRLRRPAYTPTHSRMRWQRCRCRLRCCSCA